MRGRIFAAILGASLLVASRALAGPTVAEVLQKDLPNAPGMVMTAETVTYAPGQSSAPHRHGGFLMAYVLKGAIVSQVEGEAEKTFTAGQSWTEAPGAHHLVCRNPSPTEPAEFLVVFVAARDAALSTGDAAAH